MILDWVVHSRDHAQPHYARFPWNRGDAFSKCLVGQTIGDDNQLPLSQARCAQTRRRRTRVADHAMTKPECPGLRLELRLREQISQLPMAPNHGHSGYSGCGNQHEVRIKIEGM